MFLLSMTRVLSKLLLLFMCENQKVCFFGTLDKCIKRWVSWKCSAWENSKDSYLL